ncbi:MAG: D-hexose-6-phosphate mutarotase, partial [Vibrio sp.]
MTVIGIIYLILALGFHMDFKSLPSQQTLCESIDRVTHQGMDILRLNHPLFEAAVSLHGAHLLWYKPTSQQHDVIWLSQAAEFAEDKAIRGGVPVCWPWFGKLAAPSHGFARTSLWQLVEFRHSDDKVELVLGLESSEATQAIWPHQFKLRLHFQFSDTLKIHLNIENTDKAQWLFSGALHTYFNVGDIDHVLITGMGDTYSDNLQQNKICQGRKLLGFN